MATQTELLTNPHPCRHIVFPQNDEEKALNAVSLFASSGIRKGESVVLIIADSRCEAIEQRLAAAGFDLIALQASGQLEYISANSMLRTFRLGGALDERLVKSTVSNHIKRAKASSPTGTVRIFGEMVSLLLAANEVAIAYRLEELWNEIILDHSISLLCTYTLLESGYSILPDSLERLHTHNLASCSPESDRPAHHLLSVSLCPAPN